MPTASQRILLEFFEHHLHFTPTAGQVDRFERDLALVSPYLMRAALKEAAASKGLVGKTFDDQRAAILGIYYRKVAEHAQLFPIFHTFETAFRSIVAVGLETHYANRSAWWTPIRTALRAGHSASTVPHLYGVAVSKDAAHLIGQIIYSIEGDTLAKDLLGPTVDGYAFTELCDLSHIQNLIATHWSVFSPLLGKSITLNGFKAKFRAVREARNDIYHHKSVARMTNVVTSAEELLNRVGCSLAFSYDKITGSKVAPPPFRVAVGGQSNIF
ncbi:hypothetical protein [Sphingomonas oryzagri]